MQVQYHYTDSEIKELLGSIRILVDTREQMNQHILEKLDRSGVSHESKKLEFGDYSCYLPINLNLGIVKPVYFTNKITIERKANLEELSGNLTQNRAQFENEMLRAKGSGCQLVLMVEDGSWADIEAGNYNTQFNSKAFMGSLLSFQVKYGLQISFVNKNMAASFVLGNMYYWIRSVIV